MVAPSLALRYPIDGNDVVALNLGGGAGRSVRQIIADVERIGGRLVPVREAPRRPGDPPALNADATRVRDVPGWSPIHDPEAIVRTAFAWRASQAQGTGRGRA